MKDKISVVASPYSQWLLIPTLVDSSFEVQHRQSPNILIHTGLLARCFTRPFLSETVLTVCRPNKAAEAA